MKDTESWAATMPWLTSLTARKMGWIWIHHTGHDEGHSYGDKSKEWGLNNLIRLERVERDDTDVSFTIRFEKARDREPETRADYADTRVALVEDAWSWTSNHGLIQKKLSDKERKFYEALLRSCNRVLNGHSGTSLEAWKNACAGMGLFPEKESSARSLFHKYKYELIAKNWIACNETDVWIVGQEGGANDKF
jgi:hypothetical protein